LIISVLNQDTKNDEEIYFNFINSIKSEITKEIYEYDIKLFMNFCSVTKLSDLLMITDPQKQIINYLMSLRRERIILQLYYCDDDSLRIRRDFDKKTCSLDTISVFDAKQGFEDNW
jgi:hypothetical protein